MAEKLSAKQILQDIKARTEAPPATLIVSPDRVRARRVADALVQHFSPTNPTIKRHAAENLTKRSIETLRSEIMNYSLFGGSTFHIIEALDDVTAALLPALSTLAADAAPPHRIIFIARSTTKANPIRKLTEKSNALLEMAEMTPAELRAWSKKELARNGVAECSDPVVDMLIEMSGNDPDQIGKRAEHLSLYCENSRVTTEDLKTLFVAEVETSEFALPDLIASARGPDAVALACRLLHQGKSAFPLLAITNRNLQQILLYHELSATRSPEAAKSSLGAPPWLAQKIAQASKKISRTASRRALEFVLRADSKLKGRSLSPEEIFSELIQGVIR